MSDRAERALTYAVFTRKSVRVKGDFPSPAEAATWLQQFPSYRLLDAEGREVERVPTKFDVDLARLEDPTLRAEPVPADEYLVCLDVH
jgi:hypothetical protein